MIQTKKKREWLMLWYHFFQRNCLSTIIWMNSTLSHYLNTTCGSKLHLMVTMYLHWLELCFQLPVKALQKHSNLETNGCVRKHTQPLQMGLGVRPICSNCAQICIFSRKTKNKGSKRQDKVTTIKFGNNSKKLNYTSIPEDNMK